METDLKFVRLVTGIEEAEHELAQYYFQKRFGIKWKVNKVKKPDGNMRYRLALYSKPEVLKLFNLIEPFIHKDLLYKITNERPIR